MKCQSIPAFWVQASMAFEVKLVPWSDTISPGLPRQAITLASSSDARRLKALEVENAKLKRSIAEAMLDNAGLKELLSSKW
jgi:hypothetical protein